MTTVLMLTPRMSLGYGVSEAVAMQVRELRRLGFDCHVGCVWLDGTYADVRPVKVAPDRAAVTDYARRVGATTLIAHGSPYFEVLPHLEGFRTIAYEYGDPTPEMFDHDASARRTIADRKLDVVYPRVSAVAAISEFIRHDVRWPDSVVIRLGVDHVPDLGPKGRGASSDASEPLNVICLMRLGPGEARYKGHAELLRLAAYAGGDAIRFTLVGQGTALDAEPFRQAGFDVRLSVTDAERTTLLRSADVLVTTSLWEGMNLPLVEAQALGTPGLALDTGAHPEFTPFVFDSVEDMGDQLAVYARNRDLVHEHGDLGYQFVRGHLLWANTARQLAELIGDDQPHQEPPAGLVHRQLARVGRLVRGLREGGVAETFRYHRAHWQRQRQV